MSEKGVVTADEQNPPADPATLIRAALADDRAGRLEQALTKLENAAALWPFDAASYRLRAEILRRQGAFVPALKLADQAIGLAPEQAQSHMVRGDILAGMRRYEMAVESYDAAIGLNPNSPAAHANRGMALRALGDLPGAIASYDRALALKPDHANALGNRANALADLARYDQALAAFDQALALAGDKSELWFMRANTLCRLDRPEEALVSFDRAAKLDPKRADIFNNLGAAQMGLSRFDEATLSFSRAVALAPEHFAARVNLAAIDLARGKLKAGFRALSDFRYRQNPYDRDHPEKALQSLDSLQGSTVLVHGNVDIFHGFGDTIQFGRFIPMLNDLGARVIASTDPAMIALLGSIATSPTLLPNTQIIPPQAYDFHTPLMNLPAVFDVDLATVPASPAYLSARPERLATWRARLGEHGFRVAICWQGSTRPDDHGRSFPLTQFAGLAAIPGVRLISVHKGAGEPQLEHLPPGMKVESLGHNFAAGVDGFLDTAAVISLCDLVITSDTAVAHLAGALGAPTWLALRRVPDWRWMLDRDDSPWYPSLRLYRQTTRGDWPGIFARMEADLRTLLSER